MESEMGGTHTPSSFASKPSSDTCRKGIHFKRSDCGESWLEQARAQAKPPEEAVAASVRVDSVRTTDAEKDATWGTISSDSIGERERVH